MFTVVEVEGTFRRCTDQAFALCKRTDEEVRLNRAKNRQFNGDQQCFGSRRDRGHATGDTISCVCPTRDHEPRIAESASLSNKQENVPLRTRPDPREDVQRLDLFVVVP